VNRLEYSIVAEEFGLCVGPVFRHQRDRKKIDVPQPILILFQNSRVNRPITILSKDLLRREPFFLLSEFNWKSRPRRPAFLSRSLAPGPGSSTDPEVAFSKNTSDDERLDGRNRPEIQQGGERFLRRGLIPK
jgi:hypothetical protein